MRRFFNLISFILLFGIAMPTLAQYPKTSLDNWTLKNRREATFHSMTNWDSSPYQEYTWWSRTGPNFWEVTSKMNMRLLEPPSRNPNEKYPLVVMLHGAGESGREWSGKFKYESSDERFDNNDHQLFYGGLEHYQSHLKSSSDPGHFPGYILFPQVDYSAAWSEGYANDLSENLTSVIEIIEALIKEHHVDPDRVYLHGLSNGGRGVWDLINRRPDLFAAALPMSAIGEEAMAEDLAHMPIWLFQGELDNNPSKEGAQDLVEAFEDAGGAIRYTEYVEGGHGIWNDAYKEPDFFYWMLQQSKRKLFVKGGNDNIPVGGFVEMQLSPGFEDYQWQRNGVFMSGERNRALRAFQPGAYRARFMRNGEWSEWTTVVILYQSGDENNEAPIANAGPDLVQELPKETITLEGSGTDRDGAIENYFWEQVDGPTVTIDKFSSKDLEVKDLQSGNYTFRLFVTDDKGAVDQDEMLLLVISDDNNEDPDARFTLNKDTVEIGENFVLDASGSKDDDGTIVSYEWNFGDGIIDNKEVTTHQYINPGSYNISLKVTDNLNAIDYKTRSIFVSNSPNELPVPMFTVEPQGAGIGETFTFDASESFDPDGEIVNYRWIFPDGSSKNDKVAQYSFTENGSFLVQLTVTDNRDSTASISKLVYVGILSVEDEPDRFKVYPNPFADQLMIDGTNGLELNYEIFDATGKLLKYGSTRGIISGLSLLQPGAYLLMISDSKGREWQRLFKE